MTLRAYLHKMEQGDEVTVWDNTYDIEVYFYNQEGDAWDSAMMKLASKLDVLDVSPNGGVTVDLTGLIERNLGNLRKANLFISLDIDDIMDDMEAILAGNVSENWLVKFVSCLK